MQQRTQSRIWVYTFDADNDAKKETKCAHFSNCEHGRWCLHICECLCVTHFIIIFIFALATIFREDDFNYTAMTHALPNILYMTGYILDGRPSGMSDALPQSDGIQSVKDRLPEGPFFLPPKQYIEIQTETFDMNPNALHKFNSVPSLSATSPCLAPAPPKRIPTPEPPSS